MGGTTGRPGERTAGSHAGPEPGPLWQPGSDLAELNCHLEFAVAQRARANHLALVVRRYRAPPDLDRAGLPDGQALLQQEGDAAERQVAGQDLVLRVGGRAVQDGQDRAALERLSAVVPALGG